MARKPQPRGKSFEEFLRAAPTLDEASEDDSIELSGLVSRTTDGRFAITTDTGQTYELEVGAVRDFRELEVPGAASAAAIRIGRDVLGKAVLRPVKPTIKDLIKDPIKDIIHDGKHMITDPIVDPKSPIKEIAKDPWTDPPPKHLQKDPPWDPKHPIKDTHKDPLSDPNTFVPEGFGTGAADPIGMDPGQGPVVNPAVNFAAGAVPEAAPFVMATPHQAPQHLLALQAGVQAAPLTRYDLDHSYKRGPLDTNKELIRETLKEPVTDTWKEPPIDTQKELIADTHKELIRDTYKEMTWDTWIEGGPNTIQEGVFDPGQVATQPGFGPGV